MVQNLINIDKELDEKIKMQQENWGNLNKHDTILRMLKEFQIPAIKEVGKQ